MATHKSAEKRARQSIKRNARNGAVLGAARTTEKKLRSAIAAGNKAEAKTLMADYMGRIMKAAAKGVVHTKTAGRKTGRLAERVSKMA